MLKLIVSNSMLSSSIDCNTAAVLRTLGYTAQAEGSSPKLQAGNSAHLLLEAWLQGKPPDECLAIFEQSYHTFSDTYIPIVGRGSQLRWENLAKILSVYLSLNSLNAVDFDVVETERQLSIEVYREANLVIHFTDKMDGKGRMHADGSYASIEHKTGEFIDDDWFSSYDMDGQITGHVFAGNATGEPVSGVMVNAIQFNKLPEIVWNKNGSVKKCSTHHIGLDLCQLDHAKFARRLFIRTADDIVQWKKELIYGALEYYKALVDCKMSIEGIHSVPMQGLLHRSCRKCQFKDFCRSGRNNRNYLMRAPERDSNVLSSGLFEISEEPVS